MADGGWLRSWAEAVAAGLRGPAEVALPGRPVPCLYSFLLPPPLRLQAGHLRPSAEGGGRPPRVMFPVRLFPLSTLGWNFCLFLSPFAFFGVCFSLCSLRPLDSLTDCTFVSLLSIFRCLSSVSASLLSRASISPLWPHPAARLWFSSLLSPWGPQDDPRLFLCLQSHPIPCSAHTVIYRKCTVNCVLLWPKLL